MARLVGKSDGFTIVEVAVTLVVISIFLIVILSMQAQVSQISVMNAQYNKASLLAYNNMRRYANDSAPSWFKCTDPPPIFRAPGSRYKVEESVGNIDGLPGTVKQEVYASAPYGCKSGTVSLGMPVKVESIVEYGLPSSGVSSGKKVVHATYVAF